MTGEEYGDPGVAGVRAEYSGGDAGVGAEAHSGSVTEGVPFGGYAAVADGGGYCKVGEVAEGPGAAVPVTELVC